MSKFLLNTILWPTKLVVQAYTWTTLPLYTVAQKPWRTMRVLKHLRVQSTIDQYGRKIYCRPSTVPIQDQPLLQHYTLNEIIPLLDRTKRKVGIRPVLREETQLNANGEPVKIDGKELIKVQLSDQYQWLTVGEMLDRIDSIARGLTNAGVQQGTKVILYAENSLEWYCTALALLRINAITVTLLSILNDEGIVYGVNQSDATYIITTESLLKRLERLSGKLERKHKFIYIENPLKNKNSSTTTTEVIKSLKSQDHQVCTFESIESTGARLPVIDFPIPSRKDVALIMYTSGTTGTPKGVMMTHEQLFESLHNVKRNDLERHFPMLDLRYAAYLPMAHLYGYLMNLGMFMSDAQVALCSPMTMLDNSPAHVANQLGDFRLFKPQFLGAVPLVLDRILKEVYRKLNTRSPIAAPLFTYLMDYKIRWTQRGYDTPILNRLVCDKVNQQFGGKFVVMFVGSAPLNVRTQALIKAALNINLVQAYGATEVTGASHIMDSRDTTYGQCGVPAHSVKFFLQDWTEGGYRVTDQPNPRGEIVIGGPTVTEGYYKMERETKESFLVDPDGTRWFVTGDIGEMLSNGNLKIIDRKKDLTKLANGEFVSLGSIEAGLRACKYVENICVCTNISCNDVTALIAPNRRTLAELAAELNLANLTFEQQCDHTMIIDRVLQSIQQTAIQAKLKPKEIPTCITLVKEEWTQDNDMLTAAMKMRRRQVYDFYREKIDKMFLQQ